MSELRLGRRDIFVGFAGVALSAPWWLSYIRRYFGPSGTIHDLGRVREATISEIDALLRFYNDGANQMMSEFIDAATISSVTETNTFLLTETVPFDPLFFGYNREASDD